MEELQVFGQSAGYLEQFADSDFECLQKFPLSFLARVKSLFKVVPQYILAKDCSTGKVRKVQMDSDWCKRNPCGKFRYLSSLVENA